MALCSAWVTPAELPTEGRPDLPAGVTWEQVCMSATEVLHVLSGHRWSGDCGEATAVLEHACGCATCAPRSEPVVVAGDVHNVVCCSPAVLRLPDTAVRQIVEVTVAGAVRDPATYRLARNGQLVDLTRRGWGVCGQDVVVRYLVGYPPPSAGKDAAALLAFELGKARAGVTSALPSRVTSLVRQGVTIGLLDTFRYLDAGRTGVYPIDLWLASVNRPAMGSAVWSPDLPTATRTR